MKVTKAVYLRRDDQQMTEKELADGIYIHYELEPDFKPDHWTKLTELSIDEEGNLQIDIPDSLINDIISANTETDIAGKIAKHKAEIIKLQDFRNRGK